MDTQEFLLWSLLHQVEAITSTMTLVWLMLVPSLSKRDEFNFSPFLVWIVIAGFVIGRILMIELRCTVHTNAMWLKKPFLLSNTKQAGLIRWWQLVALWGPTTRSISSCNIQMSLTKWLLWVVSMTLVSLLVTLEAMKPFTKTLHLIIFGTKMMAGLSIVIVRRKSLFVLV